MPPCVQKTISALFWVLGRDSAADTRTRRRSAEPTPRSEALICRKFRRLKAGRMSSLRFGWSVFGGQWLNRNSFVARSDQSREAYASLRSVSAFRNLTAAVSSFGLGGR